MMKRTKRCKGNLLGGRRVILPTLLGISVLSLGGCYVSTSNTMDSDTQAVSEQEVSDGTMSNNESMASEAMSDQTMSGGTTSNESITNDGTQNQSTSNDGSLDKTLSGNTTSDASPIAVEINETNFPDRTFRKYIKGQFDIDNNGSLSEQEIQQAKMIQCTDMGIETLKGVEYFTELQGLYCTNNKLKNLDISKNTKLQYLECSKNSIKELDISNCLQILRVADVGDTTLDVGMRYNVEGIGGLQVDEETELIPGWEQTDLSPLFDDVRPEKWKEIYAGVLENWIAGSSYDDFGLIYLNDDDIPELVADKVGNSLIVTIVNGKVLDFSTMRYGFCYKERGNLLLNVAGHMGEYYDYITQIGEDGFETIYKCENCKNGDDWKYTIDGKDVSEKEYKDFLEDIIPCEERTEWAGWRSFDYNGLLSFLKGEVEDNYRDAYVKMLKEGIYYDPETGRELTDKDKYNRFALIDTEYKTPILLCINEGNYKIVSFDNGLVSTRYDGYFSDYDTSYFYPKTGYIENICVENNYDPDKPDAPEIRCISVSRYLFKGGSMLNWNYSTNDASMFDKNEIDLEKITSGQDFQETESDQDLIYKIANQYVSKKEYMEFKNQTKGTEKICILREDDPACKIKYMSAEEMIEVLEKR